MLNLLLCLVLFGACSYCGHTLAKSLENRPKALDEMREATCALQNRLHYYGETTALAFSQTGQGMSGPFAGVFQLVAKRMQDGEQAEEAMQGAMHTAQKKNMLLASLQPDDRKIIYALAGRVGSDRNGQQNAFELALAAIDTAGKQAKKERESKGKLFRTGGMLAGALMAIIFI